MSQRRTVSRRSPRGSGLNLTGLLQLGKELICSIPQYRQGLACCTATLTMFMVGTVYGWTTTSLLNLTSGTDDVPLTLSNDDYSWIVSLTVLGSMIGSLVGVHLADRKGRRYGLLICSALFTGGWMIIYVTATVEGLYFARVIQGIGAGIAYTINPMYVSEVADMDIKGALGAVIAVNVYWGSLITCTVGPWVSYNSLLLFLVIVSFISFLSNTYFPETPYFLVAKGRRRQACKSIAYYKNIVDPQQVLIELRTLRSQTRYELHPQLRYEEHQQSGADVPLQSRNDVPLQSRNDVPLQSRNDVPLQSRNDEPLQSRNDVPLQSRNDEPLQSRNDEPLQSRNDEPLLSRNDEPLQSRNDVPLQSRNDEPLQSRNDEPLQSRNDEPLQSRNDEPLQSRNDEPLQSRNDEPLQSRNDEPLQSRNDEPLQSRNDVPLQSRNDVPLQSRNDEPSPAKRDATLSSIYYFASQSGQDSTSPSRSDLPSPPRSDLPSPPRSDLPSPPRSDLPSHSRSDLPSHSRSDLPSHSRSILRPQLMREETIPEVDTEAISEGYLPSSSDSMTTSAINSEVVVCQVHQERTGELRGQTSRSLYSQSTSEYQRPSTIELHRHSVSDLNTDFISEIHSRSRSDSRSRQSNDDLPAPIDMDEVQMDEIHMVGTKSTWLSKLRVILQRNNKKALLIMLALIMAQQLSGNFLTTQYLEMLTNKTMIETNPYEVTMMVQFVNLVSGGITIASVNYFGRRTLLITSTLGSCITLNILAIYFLLAEHTIDVSIFSVLPVIDLLIYQGLFQIGLGTLPNVLLCELFPTELKGFVGAIIVIFNGIIGFTVSKLYQVIIDNIGSSAVYITFAISCCLAYVLVFQWIPETKGKTYKEIEALLAGKNLNSTNEEVRSDRGDS